MMSNLNEVPRSVLSFVSWLLGQLSRRRIGVKSLIFDNHELSKQSETAQLSNPVRLRGRFWLSVFCCSHDDCQVMFPNVFGFNGGVEFLITPFEGESHGRFISVIGE